MQHTMYYAKHCRGQIFVRFARCTCGAYLVGEQQIAEHEALLPQKNFLEVANA